MSITTVLFDLDDTLHDDTGAFHRAADQVADPVAKQHGLSGDLVARAFIEEVGNFWATYDPKRFNQTSKPRAQMWSNTLCRFSIDAHGLADTLADDFERVRLEHYRVFPGAIDTLVSLRSAGFKIGMLTNGLRATHHAKIAALQLAPYFDAIFLSDEIGIAKPNVEAFQIACSRMSSLPAETVMIGDRYETDIIGGLNAGLFTVWLRSSEEDSGKMALSAHAVVRDITHTPAAIRALQ